MTVQRCPDAGILAAFVEGALSPAHRVEVERHVANCPECPVVVGEVTRFLGGTPQTEVKAPSARRRRWYIAAAIAALVFPAGVLWRMTSDADPTARLRRIAASQERHYEGRLHDFPHTQFRSLRSNEPRSSPTALRAEAERLAEYGDDADVLRARGIAALLGHDPEDAARLLTTAARLSPADAAIWNDLAVAELARASLGNPAAPAAARFAAHRATTLAPTSAETHYNLALALDYLGREDDALASYRQALALEPSESWQTEIREHIQRLESSN